MENLVLRTRSSFNGFASKDGEPVWEYWNTGVLECWKKTNPKFNLNLSFHYSITPPLHHSSILLHEKKTIEILAGHG